MTVTADTAETEPGVVTDPRRQRAILTAMCLALVAVIGSVSGLNVAQQDLAVELGASQSELLWIINGYSLALAALLLPVGAIGDRWGRKPVLMIGLIVFGASNLVAAFATTSTMLLAARVVAGVGAAMIMPVTLSVITSSFPAEGRAKAVGIWAGFAGSGGILGLFFSSFVIDYFSWPWVFSLPVGLAIASLVMSAKVVGNSREHQDGRFDVTGSILSVLAIGGIVLAVHEGPEQGWTYPITIASLVVGVIALFAFVNWELRTDSPLLEIRLFANRALAAGSFTLFTLFAVMFGIFLVLVQYLQAALGFSALGAASALLPLAALMMPLSQASPRIAARLGTRPVLIAGAFAFTIGLLLLAVLPDADSGYLALLPGIILIGIGMGLAMATSTSAITEALPSEKQGVASALNDTVREVGGALGIALLGSVLNSGYRTSVAEVTDTLPTELAEPVNDGIGSALGVASQLGADGARILDATRSAFVDGWVQAMWVGVALGAATILYLVVRGPRASSASDTPDRHDVEV